MAITVAQLSKRLQDIRNQFNDKVGIDLLEARKKIANTDNEDEKVAAAMAASRPIQFATASPVCQEDVF